MDEGERVTQEGLPQTPAMRRFARRSSWGYIGGFAGFLALGLIGFPVAVVRMVRQEPPMVALDAALVITGVIALIWALFATLLGILAVNARRAARNGTYTRYVGPITVRRSNASEGPKRISLEFGDASATLSYEGHATYAQIAALERRGSGVVDWIPGINVVLVVWDDRGRGIFRLPQFGDDPDLLPPPALRRPARPTPAAVLRRRDAARIARHGRKPPLVQWRAIGKPTCAPLRPATKPGAMRPARTAQWRGALAAREALDHEQDDEGGQPDSERADEIAGREAVAHDEQDEGSDSHGEGQSDQ